MLRGVEGGRGGAESEAFLHPSHLIHNKDVNNCNSITLKRYDI